MPQENHHKLYKYRYVIAFLYSLDIAMMSLMFPVFNPISVQLEKIYNHNTVIISLAPCLFQFMHPLFTLIANQLIDNKGFATSIRFATVLALSGVWLRCLINYSYYYAIIGMILLGIARPFVINSQGTVGTKWFDKEGRQMAVSIFSILQIVFSILGLILPTIFFEGLPDFSKNQITHDLQINGQDRILSLLICEAVGLSIVYILSFVFLKNQPPSPPEEIQNSFDQGIFKSLYQLLRSQNYILIFLYYGFSQGALSAVNVCLQYLIFPFGFKSSNDPTLLGGTLVFFGVFGMAIICKIIFKTKIYQEHLMISAILALVVYLLMIPTLNTGAISVVAVVTGILGLTQIPIIPICIELALEYGHPVQEGMSIGVLFAAGELFGPIFVLILTSIAIEQTQITTYYAVVFFCFVYLMNSIFSKCMTKEYKRSNQISQENDDQINSNPLINGIQTQSSTNTI